ncbi:transcription elongation factor A N-terminal and central domain-containing protein 2-like isoform X2 [Varroa jacobsoni]|uniref:transcription elongation factor A N-terminal and central domain-containing protein 2-like isoform X2 n=1 Tax=Varroa jacobsoni TaxID=62625 RepID=UPI000BF43688|nr:transcription elongation factor A N-terminal and central domain-containing protein 2-like isoform X2 [Varroa jacobsoni]XP_022708744.1 transcription elongation factor A N-terminal and central domain-containing protein 2-like isoform X2 [Varroa jacobsoni]
MDKFVVRIPKKTGDDANDEAFLKRSLQGKKKSRRSQFRLKDLQGVVILEDLDEAKKILSNPTSSDELLEKTLRQLAKKTPGRDILLKTSVGKPVRQLLSHENLSVRTAAKRVYDRWKEHILNKAALQKQEVRFDIESQRLRDIAKRWFSEALSTTIDDTVVIALEQEVFAQCKRILNAPYRRSCRQIAYKLRTDVNLQNKLVSGNMTVEAFVKKHKSS